jgi:tripartite-type tricarboxylate transporter receptor subunit TctC
MRYITIGRRSALLGGTSLFTSGGPARADTFPSKPIRILIPNPPGGGSDLLGRGLGYHLAERWSANVVPDNKTGAAGAIAADICAKSPPDGYTMFIGNIGPNAINQALYDKLSYNPATDFSAISQFMGFPNVLILHPSVPANSVKELIALAKAKPGELSYASSGPGSSLHLSGELFQMMTGTKITHVPYRGAAPALADLVAGVVSLTFENVTNALPLIRSGKVKALAVTTGTRSPSLPDIPTLQEEGLAGYEVVSWFGLFGPAGMPADLVERYNAGVKGYLALPATQKTLLDMGADIVGNSSKDFTAFVQSEIVKWNKVVAAAGIPKQ